MTPDDAAREIRRIKQTAEDGDGELAHHLEDMLYKAALHEIVVSGDEKSARLAYVALGAESLPFERWYS